MRRALRTLQLVQWAMLAGMLMYIGVAETVRPSVRGINPSVSYVFTTLGVALVGVIFVVRRTLVIRSESGLASQPEDALTLNHWKTGCLATYALCEALALLGLVQRFMGGSLQQSVPYYLGGFILLVFFRPRQPGVHPAGPSPQGLNSGF
jgi:hypothetical protein